MMKSITITLLLVTSYALVGCGGGEDSDSQLLAELQQARIEARMAWSGIGVIGEQNQTSAQ